MELKKSFSDTERALRSYGAVSETAWTTDKGEPRAEEGYTVLVFLSLHLSQSVETRCAVKRLTSDSRRVGMFEQRLGAGGALNPPRTPHPMHTVGPARFVDECGAKSKNNKYTELQRISKPPNLVVV